MNKTHCSKRNNRFSIIYYKIMGCYCNVVQINTGGCRDSQMCLQLNIIIYNASSKGLRNVVCETDVISIVSTKEGYGKKQNK